MKKLLLATLVACTLAFSATLFTGCKTQTLEPGGSYAPTNSQGIVVYNDIGLALSDASYKFAYETALTACRFERDNRASIVKLSPSIAASVKTAMDGLRSQILDIDLRWAKARQAYKANPTPTGLSTLQTILSEIERMIPVVQSQLAPVYQVLSTQSLNTATP